MQPDADAFRDAIFAHPGDTPRVVYADWLQEHAQEDSAQVIRLQCAATSASSQRRGKSPARFALQLRES